MSFLKNPIVVGIVGVFVGAVLEKKIGIINRIPVVRDWLA